jgi:hypothetical protein
MKKLSLILMSVLALGLMASCSSSDDNTTNADTKLVSGTKTLTINITGAHAMAGRNIGSFSTEEGNPLQVGGNEATINNLIVIVYDNDNNKFEPANKFVNPTVENNAISEKVYFKATNPSVFVVANVPLNALDGVVGQNMAAFKNATASLNVTSITGDAAGTSQVPTNLPMVGSSTTLTQPNAGVATDFATSVTLYRMVSRVALTKFTTEFVTSGRSFTVTDVFLKHVNTTSNFLHEQIAADAAKATMNGSPTVGAPHDGWLVPSTQSNAENPAIASYLISSYGSGWNGTAPAYFYVFPNTGSAFANKTQLVIKGEYKKDNTSTSTETRYYVCVVNAVPDGENVTYAPGSTTDAGSGTIAANRKYSLEVKVTDGADGSKVPLTPDEVATGIDPDPLGSNNVQLTITVADWAADIVQKVTY